MTCTMALVITAVEQIAQICSSHNMSVNYPPISFVAYTCADYLKRTSCKTKKALITVLHI